MGNNQATLVLNSAIGASPQTPLVVASRSTNSEVLKVVREARGDGILLLAVDGQSRLGLGELRGFDGSHDRQLQLVNIFVSDAGLYCRRGR